MWDYIDFLKQLIERKEKTLLCDPNNEELGEEIEELKEELREKQHYQDLEDLDIEF